MSQAKQGTTCVSRKQLEILPQLLSEHRRDLKPDRRPLIQPTRGLPAPVQCPYAVSVLTETAKPKTPKTVKIVVSPSLTKTPTRSTRPGTIKKYSYSSQLTESTPNKGTESHGLARGKDGKIRQRPIPSQRSQPAGRPAAAPKVTGKISKKATALPNLMMATDTLGPPS
ncbi:hypothetical protein PM082_018469 [Marasmius tenuissimus]|nr:hypothetical protein PM082_018469 [Marasmius tenuissimus]